MKHPQYQRHRRYGVEWLQAMITLMVLSGIYMSTWQFDASGSSLSAPPAKPAVLSSSYWNETLGYGFHGGSGDTYESASTATGDAVDIHRWDGIIYDDPSVRVSFYSRSTLSEVQQYHQTAVARTYSRLPNGIAVIEWDLSSATAKTVLATLHSR